MYLVGDNLEVWTDDLSRQLSQYYEIGERGWMYRPTSKQLNGHNQEKDIITVFGAVINQCELEIGEIVGIDYSNFNQFAYMTRIKDPDEDSFREHFDKCYLSRMIRFVVGYGKEAVFFPTHKMISQMYQRRVLESAKKEEPTQPKETGEVLELLKSMRKRYF
tara:strand:- start:4016 stop:4501 length:486 start_codon:yes stop_codon:yes gene_type:complete